MNDLNHLKNNKIKFCIILIIVLCVSIFGALFVTQKGESANAASQQTLLSETVESYKSDAARYSQAVTVTAQQGCMKNDAQYVKGDDICIYIEKASSSISTNHRVWTLTYYRLYMATGSSWVSVSGDKRIAAVCAHHGGGYNATGTGLQYPGGLNEELYTKTISSYCSNAVNDNTYVSDITATTQGDNTQVAELTISGSGKYKLEIIVLGFQNGYTTVSSGAAVHTISTEFYVDNDAPKGQFIGFTDEITPSTTAGQSTPTNQNVSCSWSESDISARYRKGNGPGLIYYANSTITEEGDYTLTLTDGVGNSTTYYFTIDTTAPTGTLSGVKNGRYTNKNVTFTWDDDEATATLNGSAYSKGSVISSESTYTIVLTDLAGNYTAYKFTIDKTAPTGTLTNVTDGGYTNKNVTFTWADDEATAMLNGSAYSKGSVISSEGTYTIVLTDLAGNYEDYKFTIDITKPTGTLSGVTVGGYTNGDVTFTWDDDEATATLNGSAYSKGSVISSEGTYTIVLTDLAGNYEDYKFTIDITKPTGKLSGVTDGGYTNKNVTFTWDDAEATATLNGSAYSKGYVISMEGTYTIVLTDLALNYTTYTFTMDKTAPEIEMTVEDREHTSNDVMVSYSDARASVTAFFGLTENAGYVSAVTAFSSGRKFTAEGNYTVKAVDAAGNVTEKHFTIDKSAPVMSAYNSFTNKQFTLTAGDKYGSVSAWEYRFNSGNTKRHQGQTVTLGGGAESNGVWAARVLDELGNTSKWIEINFAYRETFGNSDTIYNSFFVPSYYTVTLSQKNYISCFGAYTFADYSAAFSFAVSKEWECRVIVIDGGRSWNYVNPTNENTRQIYTDRTELDEVIEKYARKNISERRVIGKNGAVLNNPTDYDGVTRADALTNQLTKLPALLSKYSAYRYMLALSTDSLTAPRMIVDGNRTSATVQFISDGISLRVGSELSLAYDTALKDVISEQGWYLITERDICGNVEKYLIFIDVQQPVLHANVKYGNQSKEVIDFNQSYIDKNKEAMRYLEFDISSLSDNIDDFVMLSIEGRNAGEKFVSGDALPILNYENGYYGAYTISAYDRSRNVIEFTIYIAGEDPSLRHTSLTSETSCTFTIQINDSYNEIADIKFFKIYFDGTEERIYSDSYDTPVNAQNLVYKINVGGKYVFEFSDLYGRTVRTEPMFYMKGLPSATLRGVLDGGLTKNDVTIVYDTDVTCTLFVLSDGEWIFANRYEAAQGISTNTISIAAGQDTTAIYKALLYKTADRNLFTEYTFEIDGIPPAVQIFTEDGMEIIPETVTTQSFYVTWWESGYKAYYKKQSALSDTQYSKDSVITAPGSYVFTVYDSARNELTFSVTLDNFVSYTLEGTYALLEDGSYITRNSYVFTVTEPYSEFIVDASNGLSIINGQKLDTDGTYIINVRDVYGNAMSLTLIVDKLPPVPVILTDREERLKSGARTSKAFRVLCEEANVVIVFARAGEVLTAYDGALIDEPGTYTFRLTDRVGNAVSITVTIDREVAYRIDGSYILIDGIFHSRAWVMVVPTETVSKFEIEIEYGINVDTTKRISEEGTYHVLIIDVAGNEVEFLLVINKTAPKVQVITQSGKPNGKEIINEAFKLLCEDESAILTYSYNGSSSFVYDGDWLTEPGKYVYTVTDKLGNSETGVITIDYEVKYGIDGNYQVYNGIYCSKTWILVTPSEETEKFIIETKDGSLLDTAKRISEEGQYTVAITDVAGNTVKLPILIDKTAPAASVLTESGKELNGGAVNEPFRVVCDETDAVIEIAIGTGDFTAYDGSFISADGLYTFRLTDRIGNVSEICVYVIYDVLYTVDGTYTFKDGKYYSKSWLLITPQEEVAEFTVEDGNGNLIDATKRITAEGSYIASITDVAGNKIKLPIVIDKTAPSVRIITESGKELANGSTTGERFKVRCDEKDATLVYNYNGSESLTYFENWISEQGKYVFTVYDFIGNTAEYLINVDTSVSLTVNGTYVTDELGKVISKNWLSVTPNEELRTFYILSPDGVNVEVTGRITAEGEFSVYAEDIYGNVSRLTLVIDKTAPIISLDGVNHDGATKTAVTVICSDCTEAYYRINGGDKLIFTSGKTFELEGSYTITAYDLIGNAASVSFDIDKKVDVVPSIEWVDGCIITGSVSFTFNEEVSAKLYRGSEEITYLRGEIAAMGEYRLAAVDGCGNEATFNWTILPAKAREYSFHVAIGVDVFIELNGKVVGASFDGDILKLAEAGHYSMIFDNGYTSWTLELDVDNVAPEVQFENTRTSVKIFNPNKEGVTYTLYRNGKKVSFNLKSSAEITQTGDYRLVCEDEVGNVTEYTFTLNYLSIVSIILITVLCALALGAIIIVIILRFKRKIL